MSRSEREFDRSTRLKLEELERKIGDAAAELRQASDVKAPRVVAINEMLKELGEALLECQAVARDHGMGTIKAADETFVEVGRVLEQADDMLGALVDYLDVQRGSAQE